MGGVWFNWLNRKELLRLFGRQWIDMIGFNKMICAGMAIVVLGAVAGSDGAANGIDPQAFKDEEWCIKEVGGSLVGAGGDIGTLYGAYRFLEDVVVVHWPDRPDIPACVLYDIISA